MKKLLFTLLFMLAGVPAAFAQTDEAKAFAQKIADDIMERVVKIKAPDSVKEQNFNAIFTQAADLKKSPALRWDDSPKRRPNRICRHTRPLLRTTSSILGHSVSLLTRVKKSCLRTRGRKTAKTCTSIPIC